MQGDQIIQFFDSHVPIDFQARIASCIPALYRRVADVCRTEYDTPEAHDLRGHLTRAALESAVRALAQQYPEGSGEACRNIRRTSYYTRVVFGDVVMTASSASSPMQMVRKAYFRSTLAESSQLAMEFLHRKLPPPGSMLYAMLLHGGHARQGVGPTFLHIVFPDRDNRQYVARIDLFDRFAQSFNSPSDSEIEIVEDSLKLALKQNARSKEG